MAALALKLRDAVIVDKRFADLSLRPDAVPLLVEAGDQLVDLDLLRVAGIGGLPRCEFLVGKDLDAVEVRC